MGFNGLHKIWSKIAIYFNRRLNDVLGLDIILGIVQC